MKADNTKDKILSTNLFPVVGIGASAGGLDAFKKLLKAIPENSGIAYVLVQHLDPSHESLLPDLLQKVTRIPVLEISDEIMVEPDHIYIIPSNKLLQANDGVLQLSPRGENKNDRRNLPIDLFFTSLAEVHEAHAIGIVLSGTASDGTLGLKAIKDHGGITLAQDEASAAYESMPNSAILAGVVDFILPPEKIPEKLLEITRQLTRGNGDLIPQQDNEVFRQILSMLRIRKRTDFTFYKPTTIRRRILRRMAINKNEEPAAYLKYLRENKTEQDVLYQDLLIPVTSFFRDEKCFNTLCEVVFPFIVKNKRADEPIRVWVAGCSTGEEAYSVAICLMEFLGDSHERVQIFATDLSEPAIAKARGGVYTRNEVEGVTPQRLQEFFTTTNGSYQVNKYVRDRCVFAVHNFLKDPPFGKMDFISCRNVLIYMGSFLQKKALTTFHYSLNPKGFLLLGKSETISSVPDLFVAAAKTDKLFSRKDAPGRFMHVASQQREKNLTHTDVSQKGETLRTDFQKAADDIMLSQYTPAGVVINEAMDVVHFRGSTGSYLEQSPGKPSHNLLKMAKDGLAFELRNLLHKVKKNLQVHPSANKPVVKENIPLEVNGKSRNISIEATLLPNTIEPFYLVLFHDNNSVIEPSVLRNTKMSSHKTKKDDKDLRVQQLEQELAQTREDMRSITEDQEAANEELQSANEELSSSSEEMQSLNEELETGKEELQSTNEELTVVNQEIISLNEQVTAARDDAEAIVATIHEPMLILDQALRVKSANKSFYTYFHITEEETKGALLYDLGNKQWDIPRLRELLEDIIPKNSRFHNFELTHNFPGIGEKIMLLNASRVHKSYGEQLILLAINDITELRMKALEVQVKEKELLDKDISERKANKDVLEKAVEERTKELDQANKALAFQNEERGKRAAELIIANEELAYQNKEKEKRAAELIIANKELAFQNEEKEKRAAELIIANKELALKNEEKERRSAELIIANRELQSFAYVSSHDLQEPLRKIQTFANRILEKEQATLSDNGKDYFQRMQNAANRMQTLIEDLLAFSRVNTGEQRFEKTGLNKVMEEVKSDFKEIIEEKNAIIEISQLGSANIIPFQFRQLMQNLMGNALKFSKPGTPPHIRIASKISTGSTLSQEHPALPSGSLSPDKNYTHITIADNGIGFEPKFKDQIFDVFQRLHGKDEYAGTGIGLAIVKKIVESHKGFIAATGELHRGTTFDIYIPA